MFYFPFLHSSFYTITCFDQRCLRLNNPLIFFCFTFNETGCFLATFHKMCHLIQHLNALLCTHPILTVSRGLSTLRSSFKLRQEVNHKSNRYSWSHHVYLSNPGQLWEKETPHSPLWEKSLMAFSFCLFLLSSYTGKGPEACCNLYVEEV